MELSKQEMELFLTLPGLWSKTSFATSHPYLPRTSKLIFKTENWIIQTGNGIIPPTSRPLIKKLILQHLLHINQGVPKWFSKQEIELPKQEMKLFLPLPGLWSKNLKKNSDWKTSFTTSSLYLPRHSKLVFKTGNKMDQTGNRIISPTSRPLINKLLLQHLLHIYQGVQNWFLKWEIG